MADGCEKRRTEEGTIFGAIKDCLKAHNDLMDSATAPLIAAGQSREERARTWRENIRGSEAN